MAGFHGFPEYGHGGRRGGCVRCAQTRRDDYGFYGTGRAYAKTGDTVVPVVAWTSSEERALQ